MASPLVCVLKGKEGCDGVRLAVDYRYVNRFTRDDAYPLPDISSVFQRMGHCNFVTVADCKAGYGQIPMLEEDKWLTAFVCADGLFEFNRAPFGLKGSGNTFVRAMSVILSSPREFTGSFVTVADCKAGYGQISMLEEDKRVTAFVCDAGLFEFNRAPFGLKGSGNTFVRAMSVILSSPREFTGSFVDDVAVHSHQWKEHLDHLDRFLAVVIKHGLILNLDKCRFAQSQVRFCGEIIGSGKRFTDPEKLQVVQEMKPPTTKTEAKRILAFFSYFREHIKDFANVAQPLTDLTSKKYSGKNPLGRVAGTKF